MSVALANRLRELERRVTELEKRLKEPAPIEPPKRRPGRPPKKRD